MQKFFTFISGSAVMLTPVLAFAQTEGQLVPISNFINNIVSFINITVIPVGFAIIFLYFAYAMFKIFIQGGSDSGARSEGTTMAINAVIGVVLILSFWGIVYLVNSAFGFRQGMNAVNIPQITIPAAR